jgi:hypothetical protein
MMTSGAAWATAKHGPNGIHAGGFNSPRAARCVHKFCSALGANVMFPLAAFLHETSNDDRICIGKEPRNALWSCTAPSEYREFGSRANGVEFGFVNCSAGFCTSDNHSVGKKELRGAGACSNVHIRSDGVRGVLLLDICKHLHAVGADRFTKSQQWTSGCFSHQAFVSHVCKDETFSAHEIKTRGVCHRNGLTRTAAKNLNSDWAVNGGAHRGAYR